MRGNVYLRRTLGAAALAVLPAAAYGAPIGVAPIPSPAAQSYAAVGSPNSISGMVDLALADGMPDPDSHHNDSWFARVDKAQASQPSWITPIATVTPRLEEEVRYDQFWQNMGNGARLTNYDGGKGLELIPTATNELIFNLPPYESRAYDKPAQGWGDDTFFLVKQRLESANARNGDYIVTAFLSVLAPTGSDAFTSHAWEITPTIAGGKGWGNFDVQATSGISLPTSHQETIGDAWATNVAFQYHVGKFWPEFEVNDTYWSGGERGGKNQVLLTPGVIVGRYKLGGRLKANFGVGYQWAVAPSLVKEPLTPTYTDAWIATFRVAF